MATFSTPQTVGVLIAEDGERVRLVMRVPVITLPTGKFVVIGAQDLLRSTLSGLEEILSSPFLGTTQDRERIATALKGMAELAFSSTTE